MAVVRSGGNVFGRVKAALKELEGIKSEAGWFESAHYPEGPPVAYVAAIHEFGAPSAGIPPRPFMRPAMAQYGQEWMDALKQGASAVVGGQAGARDVMETVAMRAAFDIGKSLTAVTGPALKPATVARKGHTKPLVETGQLMQSVTGRISNE